MMTSPNFFHLRRQSFLALVALCLFIVIGHEALARSSIVPKTISQSTTPHNQCIRPEPRNFKHSCQALHSSSKDKSGHLGDQWIDCEEMSGTHGTAGSGMAVFFAKEARPYWHASIKSSMEELKKTSTPQEYKKIFKKQKQWLEDLPNKQEKALKSTEGEGGTLAFYIGEGEATKIVRLRALELGCKLEKMKTITEK